MSEPGWYPDPGGAAGHFRFWDGSSWSADTSTSPGGPPPGEPRGQADRRPSRPGLVAAVLAVVGLLIVAVVVWQVNSPGGLVGTRGGEDTNSSTPTVSAWDETSTASPTPSDDPTASGGTKVACPPIGPAGGQVVGDRMQSGGLSVPLISSWGQPRGFPLAGITGAIAQNKLITWSWESSVAVGATKRDYFPTPKRAAQALTDCFASSGYYKGFTGLKTLSNDAVTVDGHRGHRIETEVYVGNQGPNIAGDVVNVIVIDTGEPETFGVFVSSVTIGDATTQAQVDPVLADIRVVSK